MIRNRLLFYLPSISDLSEFDGVLVTATVRCVGAKKEKERKEWIQNLIISCK